MTLATFASSASSQFLRLESDRSGGTEEGNERAFSFVPGRRKNSPNRMAIETKAVVIT
jgi:hypothetical protein